MVRAIAGLLLVLSAVPAVAGEGHQFSVTGRPKILDLPPPIPPSVPYVDIHAISYTWTDEVLNPGAGSQAVMQGTCQQSIRLTVEEAQALADALQAWLIAPDEEVTLFNRSLHLPIAPNGIYGARPSASDKRER